MSVYSDFRLLTTKDLDVVHRKLRYAPDLWFGLKGLTVKVEYNEKNEPIVGTCFKFDDPCPVAPEIDTHLKYWVADCDRTQSVLNPYFDKSIINYDAEMNTEKSGGLWGYIPKRCTHLLSYLNSGVVKSGYCELVDGADIDALVDIPEGDPLYANHYFAFGTLSDGEEYYLGVARWR